MSRLLVVATLAACGTSDAGPTPDVAVELASITLGDDCGGSLPAPAKLKAKDTKIKADDAEAKRAPRDDDDMLDYGCAQTSMQLVLKATPAAKATTIKIKKVELLDDKRKLLEVLTARQPSKWSGKKYDKWNEAIAASETLQTSYLLATPNWRKLTNGRRNAHTKKFQIRVTVTVGTTDRTIEKQAIAAAMIEPDVDT
jgi:hypothetical protein